MSKIEELTEKFLAENNNSSYLRRALSDVLAVIVKRFTTMVRISFYNLLSDLAKGTIFDIGSIDKAIVFLIKEGILAEEYLSKNEEWMPKECYITINKELLRGIVSDEDEFFKPIRQKEVLDKLVAYLNDNPATDGLLKQLHFTGYVIDDFMKR